MRQLTEPEIKPGKLMLNGLRALTKSIAASALLATVAPNAAAAGKSQLES
jgi:hypothetical protein